MTLQETFETKPMGFFGIKHACANAARSRGQSIAPRKSDERLA